MKQHITIEQLNELTNEQKEKLRNRYIYTKGDWAYIDKGGGEILLTDSTWDILNAFQVKVCSLLSIGQMIEFIKENTIKSDDDLGYIDDNFEHTINIEINDEKLSIGWDSKELCDALWEVVKHILNQDK